MKTKLLLPILVMALAAGCGQDSQQIAHKEASKAPAEEPAAASGAAATVEPSGKTTAPAAAVPAISDHRLAMMQRELNLTPDQVARMQAVQQSGAGKRALKKELLDILTDEQREQWTARARGQKKEHESTSERIDQWQQLLNLEPDQVEKMRAIEAAGGGPKELRSVLTPQQLEALRQYYRENKSADEAGTTEG